jgi:hypothetical protein
MGRAGAFTGGFALVDHKGSRDSLRKAPEDGFVGGQSGVELAGNFDRAHIGTQSAAGTGVDIHIARLLLEGDMEIPGLPFDRQDLRAGQQGNI